ncbi:MAG: hypothetical protein AB8G05_21750 [Oligoflexales bacterium]
MKCFVFLLLIITPSLYASEHKERIEIYKTIDDALFTKYQPWREPLVKWAYKFVKHFSLSPTSVSLGLEIFDRFLIKKQTKDLNLYSTASLAIALKLNGESVSVKVFETLSKGKYIANDFVAAELEVCETLRWKTIYITPDKYLYEYFEYIYSFGFLDQHKTFVKRIKNRALFYSRLATIRSKNNLRSVDIAKECLICAIDDFYIETDIRKYLLELVEYLLD